MMPLPSLLRSDSHYPASLRNIFEPPDALFYRTGSFAAAQDDDKEALTELLKRPMVAIVGTRKMTSYGRMVIRQIVPPLVRAGCVIVSGLALGCDGEAHRACLDAGGQTIAVLGSGIDDDSIYPRHHFQLAHDIISHGGAVISEFEPGTEAFKSNFPVRNRIIAGLARATIVIEAEIKSGSLITAKLALEFGRDVFAVPGPIHAPFSTGTNYLIQNGAHLLASATDILECLGLETRSFAAAQDDNKTASDERGILKHLSEPRDFDYLISATQLTSSALMSELTLLELDGLISKSGTSWFLTDAKPKIC